MKMDNYRYSFRGDAGWLHLLFYGDDIVRFAYSEEEAVPPSTPAVTVKPCHVGSRRINATIESGALKIAVSAATLAAKIYDNAGTLLSEDLNVCIRNPGLEKKKLWETGFYGNGEKYAWLNHLGLKTINYNSDVLRHNNIHHPLVREMHTAIPFFIGASPGRAYGIYFDNSHRTTLDFAGSRTDRISFHADGGHLDYYFIYGPSVAEVVNKYAFLTGTMPLPRKNFLGYHQSRYSYENREELLSVAAEMRRHELPCDVLYLDIDYMDAYKVFTVDPGRFKDFREMLAKLAAMGFAVVVIIDPGVKVEEGYPVYEEGRVKGFFVTTGEGDIYEGEVWPGKAVFPDFLRREVRQWWGGLHRELIEAGVEGIWNDMNEPADFSQDQATLPDHCLHFDDSGLPVSHAAVHNLYGMLQTMATGEALKKLEPQKRPFVMTRAAFAGTQRYAALWTGDNASVWEHLECSIPMNLNLGLSGFSFTGADVGGYRGDCSGELLIRWTQLGAFIPYFRNHSEAGTARQEPWAYDDRVLAVTGKYIRLRYALLTYIYNLMRESSLTGAPAMRPLFYHYQDDPVSYRVNDQFLLGADLLVCPVVRPGVDHRLVYLPQGLWHDYWTGEVLTGGRYLVRQAPLDTLPLYVRAGAILPHDLPVNGKANEPQEAALELYCYSGSDGICRLYFDDGISFDYRRGRYSEVKIEMQDDPVQPRISFNIIKEDYPLPKMRHRFFPVS